MIGVIRSEKCDKEWWLVTFRLWRCFNFTFTMFLKAYFSVELANSSVFAQWDWLQIISGTVLTVEGKSPVSIFFGETALHCKLMVPGLHQTKPYCADAAICCGLAALQQIQILPSARISRDFAKAIKKCCSSSFKLITLHRGWHWTVYWCSAYPSLHTPCSLWSVRDVGWGGLFQTEWMRRRWMLGF